MNGLLGDEEMNCEVMNLSCMYCSHNKATGVGESSIDAVSRHAVSL